MIHAIEYIHPEDAAALRNMESIPGFAPAMKLLMRYYSEQMTYGVNMASKIRLSPTQLPEIYQKLPPLCEKLSIQEPEFYLEMNPFPNANAFGDTRTMITITSGLLEYLTDEEVTSVIAHECGHIACRHMLYHSLAYSLVNSLNQLGVLGVAIYPVMWALFYWSRRSELSADRAAAVALNSAERVVETHIRLSGGPIALTKNVNIEEFIKQADTYEALDENKWDKLLQNIAIMNQTHPFSAIRVKEILKWSKTEQYKRIVNGIAITGPVCQSCNQPVENAWVFCKHCGAKIK